MPVPSFLSSIADKAQSAINASPIGQHLPTGHAHRTGSPDGAAQPSANDSAAQGGLRSHAFESIQHQLRTFGQQYASTSPVQKIITTEKGVAIDFDSVSRDSKAQSKELYTWGQTEDDDLKDVTDRLAYLNFVQGSLASTLAVKLDSARAPLKTLRDAETALAPRRNIRTGLHNQLARIEHEQQKGMERKIAELKEQIRKAESDDASQEKEVDLLKRKAVRESEQLKWEAIREYGEKLVLLSQAAAPIIAALPTLPPTPANPYAGTQATGAARASLQRALDNYKTGHINLPPHAAGSDLSRSDTRSFGESHASELSSISSDASESTRPGLPLTPPLGTHRLPPADSTPPSAFKPQQHHEDRATPPSVPSPPINAAALNHAPAILPTLNQAPAPIPASSGTPATTSPAPIVAPDPTKPAAALPAVTPTVAETGVPVSAGAGGPGPASGSLHDIKAAAPNASSRSGGLPGGSPTTQQSFGSAAAISAAAGSSPKYETAEEEKKRLQREDRERLLNAGGPPSQPSVSFAPTGSAAPHAAAKYETAEEEKKRLEREEREKLLQGGDGSGAPKKQGDDDLPPYQDY